MDAMTRIERILPENCMKTSMTVPISVFAFLVALKAGAILPAHAGHAHHEPAQASSESNAPAQRHAADAPLREGMARIHTALDELRHYEMGHMPQPLAIEQVAAIKSAIDSVFATCKLEPEADAALHGMLVPLLDGVQAFKSNPADTSSVAAMRQAIADYPRLFDDPNWPLHPGVGAEHEH